MNKALILILTFLANILCFAQVGRAPAVEPIHYIELGEFKNSSPKPSHFIDFSDKNSAKLAGTGAFRSPAQKLSGKDNSTIGSQYPMGETWAFFLLCAMLLLPLVARAAFYTGYVNEIDKKENLEENSPVHLEDRRNPEHKNILPIQERRAAQNSLEETQVEENAIEEKVASKTENDRDDEDKKAA